jgi:hypothetical protein
MGVKVAVGAGVGVSVGAGMGVSVGAGVAVGGAVGGKGVIVAMGEAACCGPQALKIRVSGSKIQWEIL